MLRKTVAPLLDALAAEVEVWVRVGAFLPEHSEEWAIAVLDITVGAPPPQWQNIEWRYPRVALRTEVLTGQAVRGWFDSSAVPLGDTAVVLPPLSLDGICSGLRHSSGSSSIHGRFEWPYEEWTLPFAFANFSSVSDELIGEGGTPSFANLNIAMASMLGIPERAGGFDARSVILRQQFRTVRITGVHVLPAAVAVMIDCDDTGGISVELASNHPGPVVRVNGEGLQTVELPIPDGIPDSSWVLVRREGQWLDRRFINYPHARDQAQDVEFYVEALSQLESIVAAGEGPTTEFKREIPDDAIRLMKSVAAFSNGVGGTILLGVTDGGAIIGMPGELSSPAGLDTLANRIRNWVSPLPDFHVESISTGDDERAVISITVSKGSHPPYGAGTTNEKLTYFVRRGATTFPAAPDQIRELARSTPPPQSSGFGNVFGQ